MNRETLSPDLQRKPHHISQSGSQPVHRRNMKRWNYTFVGDHADWSEPDAVDAMKVYFSDLSDPECIALLMRCADSNSRCTNDNCCCMKKNDLAELLAVYEARNKQ